MVNDKGFSLMQLIVVLVVVGIISAIAIPSYIVNVQSGYAKAACNNLSIIANAEKNYYLSTGQYCTGSNGSTCGDSYADLNKNLNLNLNVSDSKFAYACSLSAPTIFLCTATINPGNTLVAITLPSSSFQLLTSGGSNIGIQISGGCVPTVPCSGANNCSTDSCGTSCGTCSGISQCSSNTAGTPGQCTCPNTCPTTGSPCGNDACGHLCGNCQVPPNTCNIAPGNTVGTCVTAGAVCAPGTCGIKDANGNACNCPDSTYSCNASHQCYQCPDLPGNTTACPNNLNQASTVYTVVPNCNTPGVCQAVCPVDPSGKNGPGYYNIVGGTECIINPVCGTSAASISCAQGVPINEWVDSNYFTYWDCVSGSVTVHCPAPPPNGPGVLPIPQEIPATSTSTGDTLAWWPNPHNALQQCIAGACAYANANISDYQYGLPPVNNGTPGLPSGTVLYGQMDTFFGDKNTSASVQTSLGPYNPQTCQLNPCITGTQMQRTTSQCPWADLSGDCFCNSICSLNKSLLSGQNPKLTGECRNSDHDKGCCGSGASCCHQFWVIMNAYCAVYPYETCVPGNATATCTPPS